MPRVPIFDDQGESSRTLFLREVKRHAPEVLRDLRDRVLPIRQRLEHCRELGLHPEAEQAQRELEDELRDWRRRYCLTSMSSGPEPDWIAERTRRTLEEWRRRSLGSLCTREEILERDCQEVAALHSMWQNSEGEERSQARWSLRQAIHQLRRHRNISIEHRPLGFHWWAPPPAPPTPSITVAGLSEDLPKALYLGTWTREKEKWLTVQLEELREVGRQMDGVPRKEVAHFRWLALWQCRTLSFTAIRQYEHDWSAETLKRLSQALSEGSKAHALRILLDRGEPWIPHVRSGLWRDLWRSPNIGKLKQTIGSLHLAQPAHRTVEHGIRSAAELIGLERRAGRAGRPVKEPPPASRSTTHLGNRTNTGD